MSDSDNDADIFGESSDDDLQMPIQQGFEEEEPEVSGTAQMLLGGNDDDDDAYEPEKKKRRIADTLEESDDDDFADSDSEDEVETSARPRSQRDASNRVKTKVSKQREEEMKRYQVQEDVKIFLAKMEDAANRDRESFANKKPAFEKMKMIASVQRASQKDDWCDLALQFGILRQIQEWLRPLSDGSLCNLKTRTQLYRILDDMSTRAGDEFRTSFENDSSLELGRIVGFLARSKQETIDNKLFLKKMLENWKRLMQDDDISAKQRRRNQMQQQEDEEESDDDFYAGIEEKIAPLPRVSHDNRARLPRVKTRKLQAPPGYHFDKSEVSSGAPKTDALNTVFKNLGEKRGGRRSRR
eukprot:TRINITY_DN775825_c0_g1_i1.p1 TRINITY_DN775825_c0_g1~~TRINITY_DN775825_c0_g1_i1.p1  ORF type:complete len:355 (-),score=129.00 TRINITY_DN775825_c0_g1_i1:13-1077(-)